MLSMLLVPVSGRDDELRPGGETLHGRGSALFVSGEVTVRGSGDSAPTPASLAPRGSPPLAVSLSYLRVYSIKTFKIYYPAATLFCCSGVSHYTIMLL